MRALITAGQNRPPRPITKKNKHLLELANKPLIFYALDKVVESGIKDVGIIVTKGDEEIKKVIGDGSMWGISLTYIEQPIKTLGLAYVIKIAQNFLQDDSFMLYLGDNMIDENLAQMRNLFESNDINCLLALAKVNKPERFGVPEFDYEGRIIKVEERPIKPKSPYAVAGIYFYDKNVHLAFPHIKPGFRGGYEISDLHTWLAQNGYNVQYQEIQNWWKDRGSLQDLLEGNMTVLQNIKTDIKGKVEASSNIQGRVIIGENTKIGGRSMIRGPVVIGNHCLIKDSYIGPFTSIGNNVEIHNGHIDHSIVYAGTSINSEKRIVDSIIGENSVISRAKHDTPHGNRLLLADDSIISL